MMDEVHSWGYSRAKRKRSEPQDTLCSPCKQCCQIPQLGQIYNASNFFSVEDNIIFNPIFEMLSSRAIQNISDMLGYLKW